MSVLYKALQKAQKENQERNPEASGGFDAERLAGSGAIRAAAGRKLDAKTIGGIAAIVLALVIVGGFFFMSSTPAPTPVARAPVPAPAPALPSPAMQPPPAAPAAVATTPSEAPAATPAMPETVVATPEPVGSVPAAQVPQMAEAAMSATAETAAPEPARDETAPIPLTPAPAPAPVRQAAATPRAPEPMPEIGPNSPARALQPPISIKRAEYDFSGVGNAVQVRQVSQQAQDNVGAGYNALIRGDYDMALGFYDRAVKQEPRSIMANLGRGAALHKMRRIDEARAAYEAVLKLDPKNREALTNLTAIMADRAPNEALIRLQELERDYPQFSPIKAQIGLSYAKLGQFDPALSYLRMAVNLTPDAVMYRYNLALVLDRMGLREQAVAAYNQLLDSAAGGRVPPGVDIAQIENRLRYLRVN
ncbi:MAG: tetratricopeptide repeat protein [Rhodobacteraceae bacterium]|nr:tetratricopeptide repeat protein [Paracoccaceae bacterium]